MYNLAPYRLALVIGIAGGSGSGKTTIARKIADAVPASAVTILEHDAYYRDRPELSYEQRCQLNFDHPDSLETELLADQLAQLRRGQAVQVPIYDFKSHRRLPERRLMPPTPIIIVEGILVLTDARLRELLDVKVFVDTDPDIRAFRRIRRDIEQRGRTFESVREQYYRSVRPMHLEFVEPSKRWSDLIIPEGGDNDVALDLIVSKLRSVLAEAPVTEAPRVRLA